MTEKKNFNDLTNLKEQTNLKEHANLLTDEEMNSVAGGLVNGQESGSIPSSGGLRLEPVNTKKDTEEQFQPKTPGPFPQNCG